MTPGVNKTIAITDAGAGTFTVTKAATSGVTLSFTLPTNLASGTDLLPIGSWTRRLEHLGDARLARPPSRRAPRRPTPP